MADGKVSSVKPNNYTTFIEAAQSRLDLPVFTMALGDTSNAIMTLGAIDGCRYSGNLTTVQASQCDSAWCLNNVTFSVNGEPMRITQERASVGKPNHTFVSISRQILRT